jgi:K+-transporting ATPase c subunit
MKIKHSLLVIAIVSITACGTSRNDEEASSSKSSNNHEDDLIKKGEADAQPKQQQLTTVENQIPSDWVKKSAHGFSFFVPPDMAERDVQGIDSYVGAYRNGSFDLYFDYGMYSASA